MHRLLYTILLLVLASAGNAQKIEALYDFTFTPTDKGARYYVVTEKEGEGWHRKAWYLPERTPALDAWYKDSAAKVPHGKETWYQTNGYPFTTGTYINGKKEGPWLGYTDRGLLRDSFNYVGGYYKGEQVRWDSEGYLTDSAMFDGAGNGTWVSWQNKGVLFSAGRYVRDTTKVGRWKYYHSNGAVMATEDYVGDKEPLCHCYTPEGVELDSALCRDKEADFVGGVKAWGRWLSRYLNPELPSKNGAPTGYHTVVVQFIVDKEGDISDIKALTKNGYGMEEEVIRLMRISPKWQPARQFGRPVKAYRRQPVTFVISER
jgi:hypothetical protein